MDKDFRIGARFLVGTVMLGLSALAIPPPLKAIACEHPPPVHPSSQSPNITYSPPIQPTRPACDNSGPWQMYIQPDGKENTDGSITGKLVMESPNGSEKKEYDFKSGPLGNGALPGLRGDRDLIRFSHDPKLPHTEYRVGMIADHGLSARFKTTDGRTQFFVPITDPDTSRTDFGIHPAYYWPNGEQRPTHGCIGLTDESAKRFYNDWQALQDKGKAPTVMEVYTRSQLPENILEVRREDKTYRHLLAQNTP
jgi:L,D-transpeptidase catalytic domain